MWSISVVVGVASESRVVHPSATLGGRDDFGSGALRLEVTDEHGALLRVARVPITPDSLGVAIHFRAFEIPPGADADAVARWAWELAVETDGEERIRWRRYLESVPRLTPEGEIERAGPPADLRPKVEELGWGPEAPWDPRDTERLLERLVREELIAPSERDDAIEAAGLLGTTVERALIERGAVEERELLQHYVEVTGDEFVELSGYPIDSRAVAVIPEEVARREELIAIGFRGEMLTIAMCDPQAARHTLEALDHWRGLHYGVVATQGDILRALDAAYASMAAREEILRTLDTLYEPRAEDPDPAEPPG